MGTAAAVGICVGEMEFAGALEAASGRALAEATLAARIQPTRNCSQVSTSAFLLKRMRAYLFRVVRYIRISPIRRDA